MSSVRACPESEEQRARATKKVKSREQEIVVCDTAMEDKVAETKSPSFLEALINVPGATDEDDRDDFEGDEADFPENRWYKEEFGEDEASNAEGIPNIPVSDKELEEWSEPWGKTLVINVHGKKINFRALENKLNRDWARSGPIKIIDMPRGFFVVQFSKDEDYTHALFEGPWMIADHYIVVQRWRRNFLRSVRVETRMAVWIRIPKLPLELYNEKFLKRLGSRLGVLLKIDNLTTFHHRGQFARISIEIDLAKPVVPQVVVRGETLKLEYEGLHTICFHCGIYGHRENVCLVKRAEEEAKKPAEEEGGMQAEVTTEENTPGFQAPMAMEIGVSNHARVGEVTNDVALEGDGSSKPLFGPWMVVNRKERARKKVPVLEKKKKEKVSAESRSGKQATLPGNRGTGSRFDGLVVEQLSEEVAQSMELKLQEEKLVVFKDPSSGPEAQTNFAPKSRNSMGAKKHLLGTRVRVAKKAARSGPLKKAN